MSSVFDAQLQGEGPIPALASGTSATGAGPTVAWVVPRTTHTLYVVASSTTGGVVTLQVSPDNQNWVNTTATVAVTGSGALAPASVTGTAAKYVRANVTTAITGGTVTAYIYGV